MSATEYRILFMVRHEYFDTIVAGTKTFELRRHSQWWHSMSFKAWERIDTGRSLTAVVMCGRSVHRRRIIGVTWGQSAEVALGRAPTAEEVEFLGSGEVVRFALGEVVP